MSRVVCDEKRCSGCLACVAACLDQHYEGSDYNAVPLRSYEMKNGNTATCRRMSQKAVIIVNRQPAWKHVSLGHLQGMNEVL